jgi:hypothetical protein
MKIEKRMITWRALILGLCVSAFVNLASPYTESIGFSNFSWSYLPEGAAIPLLFILAINIFISRIRKNLALTKNELILVFVMALVANSTSIWLIYFFIAAIVSPEYFASPENEWHEVLLPYLPKWLIVHDQHHAVRWFYEGVPSGSLIQWKAWVVPLCCWIPFFIALMFVSYTLIIFFRKQWIMQEKLAYPLMQPVIHLSGTQLDTNKPLWQTKLLWIGIIIPLIVAILDVLKHINSKIPAFPVDHLGSLNWGGVTNAYGFSSLIGCINFVAVGVGYFVPQDVLLSIWSLYLLIKVGEVAILSHTGKWFLESGGMFIWGNAAIAWQSFGSFIVFVLLMIYRARQNLGQFIRSAFRSDSTDTEELMKPRTTLLTFLIGISFMVFWLGYFHLPVKVIVIFIPLLLLIYLGIARVVCQSGIFYIVPPMIAQNPCILLLSPRRIGMQGMVSLGLTYSWHGDVQSILSGLSAEGLKLQRSIGCTGRQLTIAIMASVIAGILIAPLGVILTGYRQGALNWNTWLFRGFGVSTYSQVLSQVQLSDSSGYDPASLVYFGIGLVLMLVFTAVYYRYLWWPIHPIGLAVISSFTLYAVYIGFFIAWLTKHLILRWGGPRLYTKGMPFFIGLLIGHYIGRGIALITYTLLGLHFL